MAKPELAAPRATTSRQPRVPNARVAPPEVGNNDTLDVSNRAVLDLTFHDQTEPRARDRSRSQSPRHQQLEDLWI